jgi:hypothetical protein
MAFRMVFQLCETIRVLVSGGEVSVRLPTSTAPDSSFSCIGEKANFLDFGEEAADELGDCESPDCCRDLA